MRQMVSDTLKEAGFEAVESINGQDALNVTATQTFDFVITDVNMPVMDGICLVRQLRSRPEFRYTPILVLTTESDPSMKQRGREAGATGWMVKPFSPDQLVRVVGRIVA